MPGRKPPPPARTPAPTRIAGEVDPQVLERARQAVEVKLAKARIKSTSRDEHGARHLAEALRRLLRE